MIKLLYITKLIFVINLTLTSNLYANESNDNVFIEKQSYDEIVETLPYEYINFESSKKYYLRAIELDANYTNAYINLAALILGQEESILDQMNSLGSSAADDRKYDELKAKRNQLYLDAIPYLESAFGIDPGNYQAAKTLANIYSAVGDTDKFKEFKAISDALEPK